MIGYVAAPVSMSCSAVRRAWFDGMAKPSPMLPAAVESVPGAWAIAELMPMTSPAAFTSGPPELPGLIAASVWMALMKAVSAASPAETGRLSALTMPVVTVPTSPSGAPIATMGTFMQLLPKGFETAPYRSTDGTVFSVVEGEGESIIGDKAFHWKKRDHFVVPSWARVVHKAKGEAVLFSFSDCPVQERLDLWREQR